ncbi:MAG: hypothetical protein HOV83_24555, partial [Catenulispora sp.]|nr:hypothetical protein [Catenulispora sp.]
PKSNPAPPDVRIRVAGTALAPSGRLATLTLLLANDAQSPASIGQAEIQDAGGHRLGADRLWPAGDIPAGSTLAVDISVPYACDTHIPQDPPLALHVSVSTPQNSGTPQFLSYPLDAQAWQQFERYQSGVCNTPEAAGAEMGTISVAGTDPATGSVKVQIELLVYYPLMIDGITATNPALLVTADPAPPFTLPSNGWQTIGATWQVPDCKAMADQWGKPPSLLIAYEGPTGGTTFTIAMPATLSAQLAATACPH